MSAPNQSQNSSSKTSETSEKPIPFFVNPLKILEWEPGYQFPGRPDNPTEERLLEALCSLDVPSDMSAFRTRYVEVSKVDESVFAALWTPEIRVNLLGPLRQAKMNYILGNYVGSVTLCGIVAEKVAILVHAMYEPDEHKRDKFNTRWTQAKRVERLKEARLIDERSKEDFDHIRKARRSYLHHWNSPEDATHERAVQAYAAATRLFLSVLGVIIADGKANLHPKLWQYLEATGQTAPMPGGQ